MHTINKCIGFEDADKGRAYKALKTLFAGQQDKLDLVNRVEGN